MRRQRPMHRVRWRAGPPRWLQTGQPALQPAEVLAGQLAAGQGLRLQAGHQTVHLRLLGLPWGPQRLLQALGQVQARVLGPAGRMLRCLHMSTRASSTSLVTLCMTILGSTAFAAIMQTQACHTSTCQRLKCLGPAM